MVIMHFNHAKKLIKKSHFKIKSKVIKETFIKQINLVSFDFLLTLKVSFICIKCTHPQLIQDEFVSSSEQIWRNVALHHLLSNGFSAVNGCRQIESQNS